MVAFATMPNLDEKTRAVFRAADELLQSGVKPSERKVRATLGGGSNRDIGPALRLWWKQAAAKPSLALSSAVAAPLPESDTLPRAQVEQMIAEINDRADGERRHLMLETDRIRQEIAAPMQRKLEKLESENLLLRAKLAVYERERR
jgi:hypothetical protein